MENKPPDLPRSTPFKCRTCTSELAFRTEPEHKETVECKVCHEKMKSGSVPKMKARKKYNHQFCIHCGDVFTEQSFYQAHSMIGTEQKKDGLTRCQRKRKNQLRKMTKGKRKNAKKETIKQEVPKEEEHEAEDNLPPSSLEVTKDNPADDLLEFEAILNIAGLPQSLELTTDEEAMNMSAKLINDPKLNAALAIILRKHEGTRVDKLESKSIGHVIDSLDKHVRIQKLEDQMKDFQCDGLGLGLALPEQLHSVFDTQDSEDYSIHPKKKRKALVDDDSTRPSTRSKVWEENGFPLACDDYTYHQKQIDEDADRHHQLILKQGKQQQPVKQGLVSQPVKLEPHDATAKDDDEGGDTDVYDSDAGD